MEWAPRKGTQATAKLPADAEYQCKIAFFRQVYLVQPYDIPAGLRIGMDQTGIILIEVSNVTYNEKGASQVPIIGKNEKRAYTYAVGTAADGTPLPAQQVWNGQTARSTPPYSSPKMSEALAAGFNFTFAKSKKNSHFSTFKTMKEVMDHLLLLS
jgi:hypothetical protein